MTASPITAGNLVVSTVAFTPAVGAADVSLADVTCKLRKYDGTEVDLTADVAIVLDGATPVANSFQVAWQSAELDITGTYRMRWESNPPSPRIVVEGKITEFVIEATKFTTP